MRLVQEGSRTDAFAFLQEHPAAASADKVEVCAIDQTHRWRSGSGIPVERYFDQFPDLYADERLRFRLIAGEFRCLRNLGQDPGVQAFVARFPEMQEALRALAAERADGPDGGVRMRSTFVLNGDHPIETAPSPVDAPALAAADRPHTSQPERIGRYRVQRILGDGGFGRVYLGYDDVLCRPVAIKVPHPSRISAPEDVETYFTEARILASLDHPTIVPVYDFGRTEDGRCFAVSKYIEGSDLATKSKKAQLTYAAAAELLAIVADGLHYAHLRGIVHRDIKPANILIDSLDRPYIADFGIALQEEDFGKDRPTAGTPAYMSPEQVRGEGHLVDGRSDIFSLGVVLYELLTGRRPFGRTRIDRLTPTEPRPPRQIDDSVPQELERICLKALSQRVGERYSTARDMAGDLRHFLEQSDATGGGGPAAPALSGTASKGTGDHLSASSALTIVPKGLRSFDRDDAGFFLELLPGPRDRNGLPESVRFWKSQLTETDPEKVFRVGLIYGPSGCGKSSFLKAGVIPNLPDEITAVYVEATPADTELRLLKAIRKHCSHGPHDLGLIETLTALRRDRDVRAGTKVVIVLDQFEQWLHSRGKDETSELIRALRQCDGVRIQCIVAVRDDFWMAVTHFLEELEVTLIPGHNIAAVDLFGVHHARKILTALGRAYGALPAGHTELSEGQKEFVDKAVREMARDDQVVPVHLALFAEMVKNKPWSPATLEEVGGTEGVGVTFLEETFNGRAANPNYRLHQKAARALLKVLLSDRNVGIKGGMRSYEELREASGYADRPRDFDALVRILDSELRLITPTDPEGVENAAPREVNTESTRSDRYYHLTHDYLVPSLQEWLQRKQKETRRGRAELLLSDRARLWNARPAHRSLPSLWEWLVILSFTRTREHLRREDERRMMRAANRYHLGRMAIAGLVLLVAGWWFHNSADRATARSLVESLESAATSDVPGIVERMAPLRHWSDPLVSAALRAAPPGSRYERHLRMALLPVDARQAEPLCESLLVAAPEALFAMRDILQRYGDAAALGERLWAELTNDEGTVDRRFRAGVVLAGNAGADLDDEPRWRERTGFLAGELVRRIAENPSEFSAWTDGLAPVRGSLTPALVEIFSGAGRRESESEIAAAILAEYASDRPDLLVNLLLSATPQQHRTLLPRIRGHLSEALARLNAVFETGPAEGAGYEARSQTAARRARAAVLLFELGESEPLWKSLASSDDPEPGANAEARLAMTGADPDALFRQLRNCPAPLRAALVRTFGSIPPVALRPSLREECLREFERLYRFDPDSGVHSAAEWVVRSWGHGNDLARWTVDLAGPGPADGRNWYITRTGHTLAVFHGPIVSRTGSPSDEPGRDASDERLATRRIARDFAIGTTEVSVRQFLKYKPDFRHSENAYTPSPDCPVAGLTWHRAAEYCQWLSRQDGIPESEWCYRENTDALTMEPYPDYLTRTGYRLPTEAEWEYGCRAGAATAYSWGSDPSLGWRFALALDKSQGRHLPVGSLCPNRFGLFDMHGNVAEWVEEPYRKVVPDGDDVEVPEVISASGDNEDVERVNRGGSAAELLRYQRAANRREARGRNQTSFHTGFRIARTIR
ncbi:MAG TPA: SUMF1/EgtB/PvdO family nonheme iron enzyme [Planctomycetaceae bacterium]|nr:SUMF1/EgtB/PvdO family nonheme iron enzyme [Planctomycetaceae bacterium]